MRFWVLVMGAMAIMSSPASAQVMSWQGVGPVQLGMTVAQAERALNTKLGPVDLPFSKECYVTRRADGKDEAVSYVVVDGKIVVMTVLLPSGKRPDANIVDRNGIGIGSTEADINRAYGQVKKELSPFYRGYSEESAAAAVKERAKQGITEPEPPPHYWIEAESPDHQRSIIFETQDQKVLHLRIGLKPDVMESEDCI